MGWKSLGSFQKPFIMIMNFMNHQIPKLQSQDVYRDESMYDYDYNYIILW